MTYRPMSALGQKQRLGIPLDYLSRPESFKPAEKPHRLMGTGHPKQGALCKLFFEARTVEVITSDRFLRCAEKAVVTEK